MATIKHLNLQSDPSNVNFSDSDICAPLKKWSGGCVGILGKIYTPVNVC